MDRVKEIVIKVIPTKVATPFVKAHHYSGKVCHNSQLHFGCFLDGKLHGVMSYGSSIDKRHMIGLVEGSGWNEFLELNRMAFDDYLPRNSESFCISRSLKLIKKYAPQVKWVISFADGCSCGDGTIYRASNFLLTGIKKNTTILEKDGKHVADITFNLMKGYSAGQAKKDGWKPLEGFQLRYIYFIDKSYLKRLTVPIIPFSEIDKLGAGMYKGEKISRAERHEKKNENQE